MRKFLFVISSKEALFLSLYFVYFAIDSHLVAIVFDLPGSDGFKMLKAYRLTQLTPLVAKRNALVISDEILADPDRDAA